MITNEWIPGSQDLTHPLEIRRQVFGESHGIRDDADIQALHLLIRDGVHPVAAGRIWFDGHGFRIGECGVLSASRGEGIGDLLVKLLLIKALDYAESVSVETSSDASGFFARYGFRKVADITGNGANGLITMRLEKEDLVLPNKCGASASNN